VFRWRFSPTRSASGWAAFVGIALDFALAAYRATLNFKRYARRTRRGC
jgi:hypothetical protein